MAAVEEEAALLKDTKNDAIENTDANHVIKRELSSKEAYFAALNEWVKQANLSQNAMAMFPWYLMSSYPQLFQQQQQRQPNFFGLTAYTMNNNMLNLQNNNFNVQDNLTNSINNNMNNARNRPVGRRIIFQYRIMDEASQAAFIQQHGGYEYVIAPFWKRAAAEIIDIIILLLLKIMLTFAIINVFDLDLGLDLDKESLQKLFDEDAGSIFAFAISLDFFVFSTDLLLLEMLTKLLVCLYEALFTAYYDGATLGKAIMGLRIKHIEAMLPLPPVAQAPQQLPAIQFGLQPARPPLRALLYPAKTPGHYRAGFRAAAKNMIMTLLFPMCFFLMFFKHNRTVYDIITKTIVVEHNPQATLRRP